MILKELALVSLCTLAGSWDTDGHKIVAKLAGELLSRKAARYIYSHLKGRDVIQLGRRMSRLEHSLVSVSAWADYICRVDSSYESSGTLHFAHTPSPHCAPFDLKRDCGTGDSQGRCIVPAIAEFMAAASDYASGVDQRAEAIKFLVHLVADIHNPMHIGFREDQGGNDIIIHPYGSLHHVWDDSLIDRIKEEVKPDGDWWDLVRHRSKDWKKQKNRLSRLSVDGDNKSLIASYATETAMQVTCPLGYRLDNGDLIQSGSTLPEEYITSRKEVAWDQLQKSALRLAEILEAVARSYFAQEITAQSRLKGPKSSSAFTIRNPFEGLDNDESLEDYVYEKEDPLEFVESDDSGLINNEDEDEKEGEAEQGVPELQIVTQQLTPAERKNLENRKTRLRKARNKLLLIKRGAIFYVVRKGDIQSDVWIPEYSTAVDIELVGGETITVGYDNSIPEVAVDFTYEKAYNMLANLVGKPSFKSTVGESQKVNLGAVVRESPMKTFILKAAAEFPDAPVRFGLVNYDPVNSFQMPSVKRLRELYPTLDPQTEGFEQYALDSFQANIDNMIATMLPNKKATLITRMDLVEKDFKRLAADRVGVFFVRSTYNGMQFYIDTRVYDGVVTKNMVNRFADISFDKRSISHRDKLLRRKNPFLLAIHAFSENMHPMFLQRLCPNLIEVNSVIRPEGEELGNNQTIQLVLVRSR